MLLWATIREAIICFWKLMREHAFLTVTNSIKFAFGCLPMEKSAFQSPFLLKLTVAQITEIVTIAGLIIDDLWVRISRISSIHPSKFCKKLKSSE